MICLNPKTRISICGVEQLVARKTHNLQVVGSSPIPAQSHAEIVAKANSESPGSTPGLFHIFAQNQVVMKPSYFIAEIRTSRTKSGIQYRLNVRARRGGEKSITDGETRKSKSALINMVKRWQKLGVIDIEIRDLTETVSKVKSPRKSKKKAVRVMARS